MKYVKKPDTIEAVRYEDGAEDGFMDMAGESVPYIDTTHGFQNIVEYGDYIVTHSDGHRQCVPAEVFESAYVEYTDQVISSKYTFPNHAHAGAFARRLDDIRKTHVIDSVDTDENCNVIISYHSSSGEPYRQVDCP